MRTGHILLVCGVIAACGRTTSVGTTSAELVEVTGNADFGQQEINTTSAAHTFTVGPAAGLNDDEIEAITTTCPEFAITSSPGLPLPTPDAPGPLVFRHCVEFSGGGYGGGGDVVCVRTVDQTYDFDVAFTPTQKQPYNNCTATVHLKGGASKTITFKGLGVAPAHVATISPNDKIDWREVNVDRKVTNFVTITNDGSQKLTVHETVTDDATPTFTGSSGSDFSTTDVAIDVGQTHKVGVDCTPKAGAHTGTLTVFTDDPVHPKTDIALSCTGVVSTIDYDVTTDDPTPGDDHLTRVGEPRQITLSIRNVVPGAVGTFTSATLLNAAPGVSITTDPSTQPLPAGGTAATVPLVIRWMPGDFYVGDLGAVAVAFTTQNGPEMRTLSIFSAAKALRATVTSDALPPQAPVVDFGAVCIGAVDSRTVHIRPGSDVTDTAVTFQDAVVMPPSAGLPNQFSVMPGPVETLTVSPPMEHTVTLQTMPTALGDASQTLTITTDSPTQGSYPIELRVEGLAPGPTVRPSELVFQKTIVTGYTNTQTGTFRNCIIGKDIQILGVALDGASAADFIVASVRDANGDVIEPPYNFTLKQNGKIDVDVQMLPHTDGVKAARVVIDYQEPGATDTEFQSIALSGEAFARLSRETYYKCSTGAPIHLWPLGFVVVFVLRRRRRPNAAGQA